MMMFELGISSHNSILMELVTLKSKPNDLFILKSQIINVKTVDFAEEARTGLSNVKYV